MDDLNKEQKLAVETVYGPLLVLSGAGTGKTRVLTSRIAHILYSGFAYPWQILALTFTNKAANEMRYRIAGYSEISHLCRDLWMGTFHSMCLRILRANSDLIGLRRDFLIYDESQQLKVLKHVMENLGLSTKEYSPSDWIDRISNIKDKGIYDIEKLTLSNIAKKILTEYNAELARTGAIDFGDIILYVIKLFSTNEEILRKYQKQFKFILVDEFQDTNAAQMIFLKLLTKDSEEPNICCVGDDDQSIYSWRGAEIKNILDFEKTYKNAKIIRLETNYRSTGNILGAANSLIKNNKERLGKELKVAPGTDMGDKVYVLTTPNEWDEVRLIADTIQRNGNYNYKNFVVLIRAGSVSRPFEEEFNSRGIPYKIIGATKFYEREEIKDAISYIRLLVYPFDDISFERIISKPSRQIGPAAINKLRATGKSLMDAIKTAKLSAKQQANVQSFLDAFDFDWQNMDPKEAVQTLLETSGYMDMWRNSKNEEDKERIEHIKELFDVISKYDNLQLFLEHAALMMTDDNDNETEDKNIVYIMTIHAAKGLEFDTVFLPAWEEGIFPNDKTTKEGDIEEERRLAYVAITRARTRAIITNAMARTVFGEKRYNSPSRFINEINKAYVKTFGDYDSSFNHYQAKVNTHIPKPKSENKKSVVGKMVKHKTLGNGVVIAENNNVLTIAFKTKGIKNIVREFVEFV